MNKNIITLLVLASGATLQGLAMALFLFPHDIASGGAAGIAILVEGWLGWSHAFSIWILNACLLGMALKWLGYISCLKTIYTVTVTSVTIWILQMFHIEFALSVYVSLIMGACLFGIGVGLLFRNGASSGGLAIIAHILYAVLNILPGKSMFWMNISIFIAIAYFVGWHLLLFAVGTQWIATKVLNLVVLYKKQAKKQMNTTVSA